MGKSRKRQNEGYYIRHRQPLRGIHGEFTKNAENQDMLSPQPLATIIVPAFCAESYIAETIESVIGQTWKNWEMIVVDDASTDGTSKIVEDYHEKDPRIKLIRLEKNNGGPAIPRSCPINGHWRN